MLINKLVDILSIQVECYASEGVGLNFFKRVSVMRVTDYNKLL
ncbi:hypothetical protein EG103P2_00021 [Enterococcus phage EG103P2]|nr:hypothetical protein EG103P2_00021 [Enterococcus phage EG103P2]